MYYIIRIIVLSILSLCIYFVRKRKGSFALNRSRKGIIVRVTTIILIIAFIFIPYEAPFIRFDSAEASVRYFTVNYNAPIKTVETDNTAFCVGHIGNNFYYNTVTKYDDKYGFCDWHSHNTLGYIINERIDNGQFNGSYSVTRLVNNDTNETCYMVKFISVELNDTEDISIYDKNNDPIEKITFPDKRTVFPILVDQIDEKAAFVFYGKTYELN